ncbi:MAG: aminotransferase class I/II-fold pyridoxal phosphate-dependent enzyme, partial [Alphaproteobacteria bacterium]
MPALDASLQEKLGRLDERGQRRILRVTERDGVVARRGEADLLSFSCNDYLGLTRHPEVIKAAQDALQLYGAGAGASRLITGNNPLYNELENLLAETKGTEAACVFGSGYLANLGVIPALVGRGDLILADKLSHACMLDGAKLSGAKLLRFSHNDAEHCQQLLATHRGNYNKCLLMTETIFSMDGDPAPLAELSSLAEKFDSSLLTDDAHGLGFNPSTRRGEHGRGTLLAKPDQANPHPNPTLEREGNWVQMGTLSKASGSYGGYVCGSATLIDYIKTSARSLIYSTALPPATLAASISALRIMQQEPERC